MGYINNVSVENFGILSRAIEEEDQAMSDYCVVVADGARARLFSVQEGGIGEGGPTLVEHAGLSNAEAEVAGKDLFSDEKSGRNDAPGGGGAHGYDDHRDRHRDENERRFARDIAAAAADALRREAAARLVLAADPRMMGHLREALSATAVDMKVSEVQKDLTKFSVHEVQEHLAAAGVLPAREGEPSYVPTGQL
jgi:protein required for attachment to host cells